MDSVGRCLSTLCDFLTPKVLIRAPGRVVFTSMVPSRPVAFYVCISLMIEEEFAERCWEVPIARVRAFLFFA